MAPPAVPAVIRVEDDAVSIVSAIDSQRPSSATKKAKGGRDGTAAAGDNGHQQPPQQRRSVVSLNGQTKRVLSHSRYQETLGSIIQRDYFPSPLVAPVVSVVTDRSVLVPTGGGTSGTTLTQFHAGAASDRQVDFHQQLVDHGRHYREHVENTKYKDVGSTEHNAIFYPVIPRARSFSRQPPNRAMIEASSSSFLVPSGNRTIVPDATRFPQPMIRKPMVQPPLHFESDACSTTTIATNPSSNGYTDLDSTIVLSLRSEIRRGRQRKLRESSGHKSSSSSAHRRRKRVRPPLDSDESIGYALRKAYKRPKPSSSSSAAGSTAASVKR
jgi:hypothetical protein